MFKFKKTKPNKQQIIDLLSTITPPGHDKDIIAGDIVKGLRVQGGDVHFVLNIDPAEAQIMEQVRQECDQQIKKLDGVKKVTTVLTAERAASSSAPTPSTPPKPAPGPKPIGGHGQTPAGGPSSVAGVKKVIAVASGKGGVGKSTTSVNLALALQKQGLKVAIFDIDIYGPSIPRMLGGEETPTSIGEKIKPVIKHGLNSMSIGYLLDKDTATIWRGPMVMGAIQQMLRDVKWDHEGELDVMVIDLPPGTGDAQLTLVQTVKLDGAVIVSTPQDIALIDARKALDMFKKTNTKVLGVVENMSYFLCPNCGSRSDIFGHGGAQELADEKDMPFLGAVPLHMDIRSTSDDGTPIVVSQPESDHTKAYMQIAEEISGKL